MKQREGPPVIPTSDWLVSVDEVAATLHISKGSVYALIRQGKLPAVRPTPHRVLVRKSDLEKYLAGLEPVRPTVWRSAW